MAWEHVSAWLPTFNCIAGELAVRGTIFAPYGRDADVAGAVYTISIVNRSKSPVKVSLSLEGTLGHRQQRVRSARTFDDAHRITVGDRGVIVLDGAAIPAHAALAIGGDGECEVKVSDGDSPRWSLTREIEIASGERVEEAFYIGAGPERDGAEATVAVMRRRGWRELLRTTTETLRSFEQWLGGGPREERIRGVQLAGGHVEELLSEPGQLWHARAQREAALRRRAVRPAAVSSAAIDSGRWPLTRTPRSS